MQQTKGKGKKAAKDEPAEPKIRMITPDPVPLVNENGRSYLFELGREESCLKADHTVEEVGELTEKGEEVPEDWYEMKWVRYPLMQPEYPVQTEELTSVRQSVETNAISVASKQKAPAKGKGGKAQAPEELLSQPDPVYKLPSLPEIDPQEMLIKVQS